MNSQNQSLSPRQRRFLDRLSASKARLLDAIQGFDPQTLSSADMHDGWTVKDTFNHLIAWDEGFRFSIQEILQGRHPGYKLIINGKNNFAEWNQELRAKSADRTWEQTQADFERNTQELGDLIRRLTPAQYRLRGITPWRQSARVKPEAPTVYDTDSVETLVTYHWRHWDEHVAYLERWRALTLDLESLTIRPLSPEILPDFLSFFDNDAFKDNPHWASCYCCFYHFSGGEDEWVRRGGVENRLMASELILGGRMHGYLAYAGGRPVGWCNAGLKKSYPGMALDPVDEGKKIGAVVCFVITPEFRLRGVASRLLRAALDGFKEQGFELVEALPRNDTHKQTSNYHGPLAMYLAAGFQPQEQLGRFTRVLKTL